MSDGINFFRVLGFGMKNVANTGCAKLCGNHAASVGTTVDPTESKGITARFEDPVYVGKNPNRTQPQNWEKNGVSRSM